MIARTVRRVRLHLATSAAGRATGRQLVHSVGQHVWHPGALGLFKEHGCGCESAGHDIHLRLHGSKERVVRNHDPMRVQRLLRANHTEFWQMRP